MLELIALIWLIRKIRRILMNKGLKPARYVMTLLLLWISLELLSVAIAFKFTGELFSALPYGIIGAAIGGYLGYKLAVNAEPESTTIN